MRMYVTEKIRKPPRVQITQADMDLVATELFPVDRCYEWRIERPVLNVVHGRRAERGSTMHEKW